MTLDGRTPVLVGVAQRTWRPGGPLGAIPDRGPVAMLAEAIAGAADDSGAGRRLLDRVDSVQVVNVLGWSFRDAAAMAAAELGIEPHETVATTIGGNTPQVLVDRAADAVARGSADVVAIAGVEAMYSRSRARRDGVDLSWPRETDGPPPTRVVGDPRPGVHDAEVARQLILPATVYPVFENALRAARGETVAEHRRRIGELWARFSDVAAGNPHAWSPEPRAAAEISAVGPDNRMVSFPYTKLLNANIQVDQAAALLLCSAEAADAAGVPRDRWVFPWVGAEAHDHWYVSNRADLHSSPAIAAIGRALYDHAGVGPDDLELVDVYSCFPSAVQVGAAALGLAVDDPARPLTVTGGLTFAGGPGNNYVTHAIAALVDGLRGTTGALGLATANGWYLTKHAAGIYGSDPPPRAFGWHDVQAAVDATPSRELAVDDVDSDATVESYTVDHGRDGAPSLAVVACLLPDGRRAWATSGDTDLLTAMTTDEFVGRPAKLRPGGRIEVG